MRLNTLVVCSAIALSLTARAALAADAPAAYETFVKGATAQHGLFTIWHKDAKVYLELTSGQLDKDFVQTIVPSTGLFGQNLVWGNTDHLPTELVRFERAGNSVAILWPQPYFIAPHSEASQRAIAVNFPRSIVGLAPIAAEDAKTGTLVIDASPFLDDQLNLKSVMQQFITPRAGQKPEPYSLDKDGSYFGTTKAFPNNDVLEVMQDWTSPDQSIADVTPDPRHIQMRVTYNLAAPPENDGYRPRLADDRIGIYNDIYLTFDNDQVLSRALRYIVRWNLQPSDPTKKLSPATHPMVFYMSNTVPEVWRPMIKAAVLKWNAAFERLGISDALQVRDQPNDPDWDPDDIRYNVLRWVTEYTPSFGADSQTLYDPRTGEEFRTGVLISADVPVGAVNEWTYVIDPTRYGRSTDPVPTSYMLETWLSTIMHETGHNLGMQHNFIGARAYTAKQLQDKNFTEHNGIASTVMEYAPTNIWPAKDPQGNYNQVDLGPYDYYVMHWAYGRIPGANTPEQELPTLERWASAWSDPRYRYASDEDVSWGNGHAADPRVGQFILTNDPLGWCDVQLGIDRDLFAHMNQRYPNAAKAYEDERNAFLSVFGRMRFCATMPTHYIGGQYISRAHRGDAQAEPPIVPVPKAVQRRAFDMLDKYLFGADAWRFSPALVSHLGYSEWAGYGYVSYQGYGNLPEWAYNPPDRHDISIADFVGRTQGAALAQMFQPLVLGRIADAHTETSDPHAMQLEDLFDWMHASVYRELRAGGRTGNIGQLRRALQVRYTQTLAGLVLKPDAGTPGDAVSLARDDLAHLESEAAAALRSSGLDRTTRAHLEWLRSRAHEVLTAYHPT